VLLKVGDDLSTDEILPAGQRVLPYRSNIPKISEFTFWQVDEDYPKKATPIKNGSGHIIIGGDNYGQGSSREHAALAPRYLGLRAVIAKSFARIHWQNLANFGVLALEFTDASDYESIEPGDVLALQRLHSVLRNGPELEAVNTTRGGTISLRHRLSPRQVDMVLAGGLIPVLRERLEEQPG
jgi:aconitate hydratase